MEHHHHIFDDQTKILHMNLKCCQACPRLLKKKLPNIPGVDSVRIDKETGLIFVTGPIDAMTLVNTVAQLGKTVYLLPNVQARKKTTVHIEEIPTGHESHQSHSEGYSSSRNSTSHRHRRSKGKTTHEGPPPQHKHEREEFDDFYQNPSNQGNGRFKPGNRQGGGTHHQGPPHDHVHNHHKQEDAQEEEHKCEEYKPFIIDPRACRDFYCLTHPPMRDVGYRVDGSDDGSSLMRTSPFSGNFGPGGGYYGAPYFGNPSMMYGGGPPHQYGYNQPRMLQRPFGFQ